MLDTSLNIETPEGVVLQLNPAGPLSRGIAYAIDAALRIVLQVMLLLLLSVLGYSGMGLMAIVYFLLEWFYPVYFEIYHLGITPGKKRMGLRVVNDDGTPISWAPSLIRNLLRVVDFLPAAYFAGLFCATLHPQFKRLGDLAAATLVVYTPKETTFHPTQKQTASTSPYSLNHSLTHSLSQEEQQLLINYSELQHHLTQGRSEELANILSPILGKRDDKAREALIKIANGYLA